MEGTLPLESWTNFYVIVGSAAAGLTGLTFVVITLVADTHAVRLTGLRAFITPTIVHFCTTLGLAALLNVPKLTALGLGICLGVTGLIGVFYSARTVLQMRRNRPAYVPVAADWIWNAVLPSVCYLLLLLFGWLAPGNPIATLYVVAAISLLLLLVGIHNAWDIAVWFTAERPQAQVAADEAPPPAAPPARQRPPPQG